MSAFNLELALEQLANEISDCKGNLLGLIKRKKQMVSSKTVTASENDRGLASGHLHRTPIAIIGMASIFPEAIDTQEFWDNIVQQVDCITDVPSSRWNIEDYYDPDPFAPDKTYCKRGGFIPDVEFDPMEFGLPPKLLEATDVSQLLSLLVGKQALEDAGYGQSKEFNRERTGVILGAVGRQLSVPLSARLQYPIWERALKNSGLSDKETQRAIEKIKSSYVEWEENSFPGMLSNVISGRIANRLDLGGINCTLDAACASSLAALKMSISELVERRCDMMLTGGVDPDNSAFTYLCFSKTPALTRQQNSKPFDRDSEGILLGEGLGMVVLKRLEDAERDGDRIHAVIKGIGVSSDGRYKSIYAPRSEGQAIALRRAYEDAGCSPETIGLIEAHGTGTKAGDLAEFSGLRLVFDQKDSNKQHIALGSVKSQIGHTKTAAGVASLIKTSLALSHKILPPTINIEEPNPKFDIGNSPFYLNTETRPWICSGEEPRRAGVSSFGFGGTNYHVVLEEYEREQTGAYRLHATPQAIVLCAETPQLLLSQCKERLSQLEDTNAGKQSYSDLIYASNRLEIPISSARIGFVAGSQQEACDRLRTAIQLLKTLEKSAWEHPHGIYYRQSGFDLKGKVVALFPGQGSQYLEMGRELAVNFPPLRNAYGMMDKAMADLDDLEPVSNVVYPKPVFGPAQQEAQAETLKRTEYAQPAIGAFSVGLYQIFQNAGFQADFVAGHSFGELTALWAAGALADEDYFFLVKERGQAMSAPAKPDFDAGSMLAVNGDASQIEAEIKKFPQVVIANYNSPQQVVLAGAKPEILKLQKILEAQGYSATLLQVSAAFHTPLVGHAQKPFSQAVEKVTFNQPQLPIFSNVTGKAYPTEASSIKKLLKDHILNQVNFKQEIENIYAEGGFCFVEFGPRSVLTYLVKDILKDKPHVAVALNASRQKDSDLQFREAVVQLRVAGLSLKDIDPYRLDKSVPEAPANSKRKLSVILNGANYVSEKTKASFAKALESDYRVPVSTGEVGSAVKRSPAHLVTAHSVPTGHGTESPLSESVANGHSSGSIRSSSKTSGSSNSSEGKAAAQSDLSKVLLKSEKLYQSGASDKSPSLERSNKSGHSKNGQSKNGQSKNGHGRNGYAQVTPVTGGPFQVERSQTLARASEGGVSTIAPPISAQAQVEPHSEQATPEATATQAIGINTASHATISHYQRILESLEFSLEQFGRHQESSLQVHGQYLTCQAEYTRAVFKLMQQQNALFAESCANGQSDTARQTVLESSERSMNQFHECQANTLTFHEQYLNQQMEYAKTFFQMTKEGFSTALGSANTQVNPSSLTRQELPQQSFTVTSADSRNKQQSLEINAKFAGLGNGIGPQTADRFKHVVESLRERGSSTTVNGPSSSEATSVEKSPEIAAPTPALGSSETESSSIAFHAPISIDEAQLDQTLLEVVSDKTGYPIEMLEMDMDMEADLGIDSIKRVEILGALQDQYPDMPQPDLAELAELEMRTLAQVVEYMQSLAMGGSRSHSTPVVAELTDEEALSPDSGIASEPLSLNEFTPAEKESHEPVEPTTPAAIAEHGSPETVPPAEPLSIDAAQLGQTLLEVVSDKTGYPVEMLEMDMDMEADLGIDSIKRVEILGALQDQYPDMPQPDLAELAELEMRTLAQVVEYMRSLAAGGAQCQPTPAEAELTDAGGLPPSGKGSEPLSLNGFPPAEESFEPMAPNTPAVIAELDSPETVMPAEPLSIDAAQLGQILLEVVTDKTGYPVEMLEMDMDMEADLGIDSIKRVEILGAMQDRYPDMPQPDLTELAELEMRTLAQVVEYMRSLATTGAKKSLSLQLDRPSPNLTAPIPRSLPRLKFLPDPDRLEFNIPADRICLMTDDGSPLTSELAQSLTNDGWKVVVLGFPQSANAESSPLPEGIVRVTLENWSEDCLEQKLTEIQATYGSVAVFIHLNPYNLVECNSTVPFPEAEAAIIKHVFFIAKHLKDSLNEAGEWGRSCFLTVARLDGEFGQGQAIDFSPIGGGLFGLTKSLNYEWKSVFCRAIDLNPAIDVEQSVRHIIAELCDPNRQLVEVGYGVKGRTTLVAEPST